MWWWQELEAIRVSHLTQMQQKAKKKEDDRMNGEAEAAKFIADYEAGLSSDQAAEAARRKNRIALKNYHLKQVRA